MKNTLFILALLVMASCNVEYSPKLLESCQPPTDVDFTNSFTLQLSDSLNIPLPKGIPPYFEFADFLVEDSLYYYSYGKHKLAKVDLIEGKFDSIILPKHLITGNIVSICVINEDSILITQDAPESLVLFDSNNVLDLYRLPKIDFKTSNQKFYQYSSRLKDNQANFLIDFSKMAYDPSNRTIHIGIQPLNGYDYDGFEDSERVGVFDLHSKKWVLKYAPPKGMMKNRGDKTYSSQMSTKTLLLKNDTMFVSYTNDHYVYYYQNGKYLGKFPHISSQSKKLFLPVDSEQMQDVEQLKKYVGAAPKYSGFHYHKDFKLYSRLYFDQQDPMYENGKYKPTNLYRDVYAIFLDENFNHVGEFKFANGSLELLGAKPLSDGFAIYSTSHNDLDSTNNFFKLKYIYKIKSI